MASCGPAGIIPAPLCPGTHGQTKTRILMLNKERKRFVQTNLLRAVLLTPAGQNRRRQKQYDAAASRAADLLRRTEQFHPTGLRSSDHAMLLAQGREQPRPPGLLVIVFRSRIEAQRILGEGQWPTESSLLGCMPFAPSSKPSRRGGERRARTGSVQKFAALPRRHLQSPPSPNTLAHVFCQLDVSRMVINF
jgi:hypothetical protein